MPKIYAENKKECFISHIEGLNKFSIRREVCQELPVEYEHAENWYCVLHFPKKSKLQETNFNQIYEERIANKNYNFRGVYFPSPIFFPEDEHDTDVIFNGAVFNGGAFFRLSTFKKNVEFILTEFHLADFSGSTFDKFVSFKKAKFLETKDLLLFPSENKESLHGAHFKNTKFTKGVDFTEAEFHHRSVFWGAYFADSCFFNKTIFEKLVSFKQSKFEKNSKTYFERSIFKNIAFFAHTDLDGYLTFQGDIDKKVFENEASCLNLDFSKVETPQKIHFNQVILRPNWFINVDSREFIFTDVYWKHIDSNSLKTNIKTELKCVEERKIKNSKQLFKIACRQLSDNAENNNRFEESSDFRRMAMETEWLEKKEKLSNWIKNLVPESEKLKRRFGGSTDEEDKPNPPTNSFGVLRRSGDFIIHGLYRITSFYGESWSWAAFVLMFGVLLFFPLIYTNFLEFQVTPKTIPLEVVVKDCPDIAEELKLICKIENRGLNFWSEAIPHSLATATLQTVEYRVPKTPWGSVWIILEKIFAPLQAALLALAIRRKFMR